MVISADLHLHTFASYAFKDKSGMNSRLNAGLSVLEQIYRYCHSHDDDKLHIHLGDFFHARRSVPVPALDGAAKILEKARTKWDIDTIAILGNHDRFLSRDSGPTSTSVLGRWMTVISKPTVIPVSNDVVIFALPWLYDIDEVRSVLRDFAAQSRDLVRSGKTTYLMGHIGIDGAVVGVDDLAVQGSIRPAEIRAGSYTECFFGHFHTHQMISGTDNAMYVGSPLPVTMAERVGKKGFIHLTSRGSKFMHTKHPVMHSIETDSMNAVKSAVDDLPYGSMLRVVSKHLTNDDVLDIDVDRGVLVQISRPKSGVSGSRPSISKEGRSWASVIEDYLDEVDVPSDMSEDALLQCAMEIVADVETSGPPVGMKSNLRLGRIQSMIMNSFGVYENEEIRFPDGPCVVLISGENRDDPGCDSTGSGKSTILNALCWGLYGKAPEHGGKRVTDEFVSRGCDHCAVSLMFDTDSGVPVQVVRQHGAAPDLAVLVDGVEMSFSDKSDAQSFIDAAVGCSYGVFVHTVMRPQNPVSDLVRSTDADKKRLLEDCLSLSDLSAFKESAGRLASLAEARADELRRDIGECESFVQNTTDQIALLEQRIAAFDDEQADRINKLAEMRVAPLREWRLAGRAVRKARRRLARLEANPPHEAISALEEIRGIDDRIKQIDRDLERVPDGIRVITAGDKMVCVTCDQVVSEKHLARFNRKMGKYREALLSERSELVAKKLALRDKTTNRRGESRVEAHDRETARCREKIREMDLKASHAFMRVSQIDDMLTEEHMKRPPSDAVELIAIAEKRISDARIRLCDLRSEHAATSSRIRLLRFWRDRGFASQGLKAFVLRSSLPEINDLVQLYYDNVAFRPLTVMLSGESSTKRGEIRDRMSMMILDGDEDIPFKSLSGGEKTKVVVSVVMGASEFLINHIGVRMGSVWMDEIFDGLDQAGTEIVVNSLRMLSQRIGTVFIVSNNPSLVDLVDTVWTVVKSGGSSTLRQVDFDPTCKSCLRKMKRDGPKHE